LIYYSVKMTSVQGENVPNRDVVVSRAGQREIIKIGAMTLEVMEDGTNTDRRIGAVNINIPAHTDGPMQHWQYVSYS
jgi:hypothetical protein